MKIGDIVEVHQIVALGPDRWVPAEVISIWPGVVNVKAVTGSFDNAGHDLMSLQNPANPPGKWRRA